MTRKLIIATGLFAAAWVLSGCQHFSAPAGCVEYHNRVVVDCQIEKWNMGGIPGTSPKPPQPVWDDRREDQKKGR